MSSRSFSVRPEVEAPGGSVVSDNTSLVQEGRHNTKVQLGSLASAIMRNDMKQVQANSAEVYGNKHK